MLAQGNPLHALSSYVRRETGRELDWLDDTLIGDLPFGFSEARNCRFATDDKYLYAAVTLEKANDVAIRHFLPDIEVVVGGTLMVCEDYSIFWCTKHPLAELTRVRSVGGFYEYFVKEVQFIESAVTLRELHPQVSPENILARLTHQQAGYA